MPSLRATLRSPVTRNRLILFTVALVFYAGFALHTPALLDDADSVHAEVAREMLLRHDWVTLYANGIRYLEKAPLLYWSMAASMRVFGVSAAAARLPLALTVFALALTLESFARRITASQPLREGRTLLDTVILSKRSESKDGRPNRMTSVTPDPARRAARAGLLAGLITLSSFGIFIFTRITIPDATVCLFLTLGVLCFWRMLERGAPSRLLCWGFAAACALGVLTKGLIGLVFPVGVVLLHLLAIDGLRELPRSLRRLYPWSSTAVFLLIAAPWHIAAGLANPTQGHPTPITFTHGHWTVPLPTDGNVHGWFWFYFVNEHVLRYLNLRVPRDYDTVPLWLFLGLVAIWLMPWSAFLPKALAEVPWHALLPQTLRTRLHRDVVTPSIRAIREIRGGRTRSASTPIPTRDSESAAQTNEVLAQRRSHEDTNPTTLPATDPLSPTGLTPRGETLLLLGIWAALPLAFFSLSTRQEYYVLPALPAMILLITLWLTAESDEADTFAIPAPHVRAGQRISIVLLAVGALVTLACGLFAVHTATPSPNTDLASLLAQNPGDYALSFGHFLDLNARALGLFRAPLLLTALAAAVGSLAAWWLRRDYHPFASNIALVAAALLFLVAAHAGLRTFAPVLSSAQLADAIALELKPPGSRRPDILVINGEYESGSSLGFYLERPFAPGSGAPPYPAGAIHILNGRSSNLWYGSFFPDAPPLFETDASLAKLWAGPQRVFLWTDPVHTPTLPGRTYELIRSGGKEILSNRPNGE